MSDLVNSKFTKDLIPAILLFSLIFLAFMVLREFLLSLIWALIITYVIWPPYRRLKRLFKKHDSFSAALMTALITAFLTMTVYWLADLLRDELKIIYQTFAGSISKGRYLLPDFLSRIPWLGEYLQNLLDRLNNDKASITSQFAHWTEQWLGDLAVLLGSIGENLIKLGVILVTVFFCLRDGETIVAQLNLGLVGFLGKYQHIYLKAAGQTTRAVVYGLVLAALGQGLLAGFGYAVAGVKAPMLFAIVTALLALAPMGAVIVWLPLSLGLILMNHFWQGIGLFLWGLLVVSTIDNFIRPLVISGASHTPFIVVMFGVLGGLSVFGAVGLFLGPVILAVLLSVWQEWIKQQV